MKDNEGFWMNGGLLDAGSSATISLKFDGISWVFLMNHNYKVGGMLC